MTFVPFTPPPGHTLSNVRPTRAQFSEPVIDIEVEQPKRSRLYRWRWALFVLTAITWFLIARDNEIIRIIGGTILVFWFFAIGTMPHMAAGRYIGEVLDGDD